jgi:hypothetical protein
MVPWQLIPKTLKWMKGWIKNSEQWYFKISMSPKKIQKNNRTN